MPTKTHPLLIDVSKWNTLVNYTMLRAKGVQGLIARAGGSLAEDRMLRVHAAGARAAGMILGLYYWVDPTFDGRAQANHFATLIEALKPDLIAGDMEQWWANWDKWLQWRFGEIEKEDVPRLSTRQISVATRDFMQAAAAKFPKLRLLLYTSPSFVNSDGIDTLVWMNDYPIWLAQWPKTGGSLAKMALTWEELQAGFLPTTDPAKHPQMEDVKMWQWSGERFTLPGHSGVVDLDWFMGTDKQLLDWLDKPALPPPAKPNYSVHFLNSSTFALNVRKFPNAHADTPVLRVIVPGEEIFVADEPPQNGGWVKLFGEPGFVNSNFITP